jgi:hypothetical protein
VLTAYETNTQNLLQKPGASTPLYDVTSIDRWINIARGQLAGEAECIRAIGTISTVVGQSAYNFASINIGVSATTGRQGVINVRRISYGVASGQRWVPGFAWEWFDYYHLNNPVPPGSYPQAWSQFAQGAAPGSTGSAQGGSFYINVPDAIYTLYCDCVCYPIALVDDTTVEAIPYLWTDAVPYFAAYYALLSAQSGIRTQEAKGMMELYKQFLERARRASNASVNRWQYEQSQDPAQLAKFGVSPTAGAK